MRHLKKVIGSAIIFGILTLWGCGGKEYTYVPEADEMQTGPGLISGDDGTFTVYNGVDRKKKEEEQTKK
jgi:hypothetical protein